MNDSTPRSPPTKQVARIFEWRRGFNNIHLIDTGRRAQACSGPWRRRRT